jgi:hypothetical protein
MQALPTGSSHDQISEHTVGVRDAVWSYLGCENRTDIALSIDILSVGLESTTNLLMRGSQVGDVQEHLLHVLAGELGCLLLALLKRYQIVLHVRILKRSVVVDDA